MKKRRGKYPARWREADGTQRTKSFALARDAKAYKAEMERRVRAGTYISPGRGEDDPG